MSYDYNAIVSSITFHRQNNESFSLERYQSSVDLFTDLSTKCPMTPMLWMRYAHDAGFVVEELMRRSLQLQEEEEKEEDGGDEGIKKKGGIHKRGTETRKDVLELALEEFPGCAALQLRYLEEVCQLALCIVHTQKSNNNNKDEQKDAEEEEEEEEETALTDQQIRQDFENALSHVGNGSHQNDDVYVSRIYRLYIWYMSYFSAASASSSSDNKDVLLTRSSSSNNEEKEVTKQRNKDIMELFARRAKTPMKFENDSLSNELNEYLKKYHPKVLENYGDNTIYIGKVEEGRMFSSKLFGAYATLEDGIDAAMERDGILIPKNVLAEKEDDDDGNYDYDQKGVKSGINWDALLNKQQQHTNKGNDDNNSSMDTYLMGLGAMNTSAAFLDYVKSITRDLYKDDPKNKQKNKKRKRNAKNENDDDDEEEADEEELKEKKQIREALILSVFERAVSECPTVESVWVSYVRHLLRLVANITTAHEEKNTEVSSNSSLPIYLRRIESVSNRSVRNCPYSVTLFDMKMKCVDIIAQHDASIVFDADKIVDVVKEALDGKFLPDKESYLKVYLSAVGVIKRRILSKVSPFSKRYDDADGIDTRKAAAKKKQQQQSENDNKPGDVFLDSETEQEVLDIIDDLRELYDEADSFLRKSYGEWTEGRAVLWKDRAEAEAQVLAPLVHSLGDGEDENTAADGSRKVKGTADEVERCFEKLVRVHHPSHPDSWLSYVRYVAGKKQSNPSSSSHQEMEETPGATVGVLRKVRGLYRRAMQSVKKQKLLRQDEDAGEKNVNMQVGGSDFVGSGRSYEIALHCLCHEYLEFERAFGSGESYNLALKLVKAKIATSDERGWTGVIPSVKFDQSQIEEEGTGEESVDAVTTGKRKHTENADQTVTDEAENPPAPKRRKTTSTNDDEIAINKNGSKQEVKPEKRTNLKEPKILPEHTVRVGKLDFPAHPFTIRVTNLSPETEDMDLVDAFKYKCGAIVHAKILREKHHHRNAKGMSKCEGLVQFEERESVEKALQLNEEIGLHEKLIHVGRSHAPAVGIVPPGMHRVNPQGEGRSTKRNLKRKEKMDEASKSSGKEKENKSEIDIEVASQVDDAKNNDNQKKTGDEKDSTKEKMDGKDNSSDTKKRNPYLTSASTGDKQAKKGKTQASDILAFRPRGLHGQRHHKVKVALSGSKASKK